MKWLPKLMGFDYEIQFKNGVENVSADALSRIQNEAQLFSLFSNTPVNTELLKGIVAIWEEDTELKAKIQKLKQGEHVKNSYVWTNQQLRRKGKLVVGKNDALKTALMTYFHSGPVGGHVGVQATLHKLCSLFYWRKIRREVKQFVRECDVCQRCKPDVSSYPGLLQPLPIPNTVWSSISMDFVEGLPKSQGKNVIMVVVDRLSNIVCDRDKVFISLFWKGLFKLLHIKLLMSTAYHTQTDGQTEVVNRSLECYLRCMCGEKPKEWSKWLSLAEWWYNTNYHTCLNTTPYEVLYGQTPPIHIPYVSEESRVDKPLFAREEVIQALMFHLGL
ncbi:ty3-gypsy retrotransposon protein [Tanacetum coccineum]